MKLRFLLFSFFVGLGIWCAQPSALQADVEYGYRRPFSFYYPYNYQFYNPRPNRDYGHGYGYGTTNSCYWHFANGNYVYMCN